MTIAAVLLGALTTHVTNHLMERSRNRHRLLARWDDKKVDAYGEYVDAAKMRIAASVPLYEVREGLRESHRSEEELREDLAGATLRWGAAFERVMLLGGDEAIESGHELNVVLAEIDWQATGRYRGQPGGVAGAAPGGVPRHQRLPRGRQGRSRHPGRRHRGEAPGARSAGPARTPVGRRGLTARPHRPPVRVGMVWLRSLPSWGPVPDGPLAAAACGTGPGRRGRATES
ncbi:hypothetical protein STENM327S_01512 [Streptomyces tendae]